MDKKLTLKNWQNDANYLTKYQKIAIFLISLGSESAAKILNHMPVQDSEIIIKEIKKWKIVPLPLMQTVLEEMKAETEHPNLYGGLNYADKILDNISLNARNVNKTSHSQTPASNLQNIDPQKFSELIKKEQPQTIAFILSTLPVELSSEILKNLSSNLQIQVATKLTSLSEIKTDILKDIEELIQQKYALFSDATKEIKKVDGINVLAGILNQSDPEIRNKILTNLEKEMPDVVHNVKEQMFGFEDIIYLSDADVQLIIQATKTGDLAVCLKLAGDEVKEKIFKNMSKRAVELLQEETTMLAPMRISDVRAIQKTVVNNIKHLAEQGKIVISRKKEEFI